jgi:hypothetical protein
MSDPAHLAALRERLEKPEYSIPQDYKSFIYDPLSSWIESYFGIRSEDGRLRRARPKSIYGENGAAAELGKQTGVDKNRCAKEIEKALLAGYTCEPDPETKFPVFAFRLHQFITRGESVFSSLETEAERQIALNGQQFVPGDRSKILLPLVFCRECGQEYYSVKISEDEEGNKVYRPRELSDRQGNSEGKNGFLFKSDSNPWPIEFDELIKRLPDDWFEENAGSIRIRPNRKEFLPKIKRIGTDGVESESGSEYWLIPAPFRFCLHCGISYDFRQSSDFGKLSLLGMEGRSTATTILSLSIIRSLREDKTLAKSARKLLSFTDNRQDASLQAGHFNDFVEIGILRSALYQAVSKAYPDGIRHEELAQRVFNELNLPLSIYAADPEAQFQRLVNTQRALRSVIGYRIYRDLKRGWRVAAPNLEQCGLLEIRYESLDELCKTDQYWQGKHQALVTASPETRKRISKVLLDFMRRELCIKIDYLDQFIQERIKQESSQHLKDPWAIDEDERLDYASTLFPEGFPYQH